MLLKYYLSYLITLDEEVLINQKDVPDVTVGDVVEIYHIEDEER